MRTIKFKAKRIGDGEWVYGALTTDLTNTHKSISQWERIQVGWAYNQYDIIPETVCQFTGLTDKNGVEIYEGDTIEGGDGFVEKCSGVVKYQTLAFCIVGETASSKEPWFYTITTAGIGYDNGLTVTGNIHDKK